MQLNDITPYVDFEENDFEVGGNDIVKLKRCICGQAFDDLDEPYIFRSYKNNPDPCYATCPKCGRHLVWEARIFEVKDAG